MEQMTDEEFEAWKREHLPTDARKEAARLGIDIDREYTAEDWADLSGKPDFVPEDRWLRIQPALRPAISDDLWRELLAPKPPWWGNRVDCL